MQPNNNTTTRLRTNYQIKVPQVRLISDDGSSTILPTQEAITMAKEVGLDLVEINPRVNPIIAKILDVGKFLYEEKKKAALARRNQQVTELKEITFHPNTDDNDLAHKLNQAKQFLSDGNKVKFTIRFRGREVTHPEVAHNKMKCILQELSPHTGSSSPIGMEGKLMFMTVNPK